MRMFSSKELIAKPEVDRQMVGNRAVVKKW